MYITYFRSGRNFFVWCYKINLPDASSAIRIMPLLLYLSFFWAPGWQLQQLFAYNVFGFKISAMPETIVLFFETQIPLQASTAYRLLQPFCLQNNAERSSSLSKSGYWISAFFSAVTGAISTALFGFTAFWWSFSICFTISSSSIFLNNNSGARRLYPVLANRSYLRFPVEHSIHHLHHVITSSP